MKQMIIAAIAALFIVGCGGPQAAAENPGSGTTPSTPATGGSTPGTVVAVGYDKGSKKVGDKGVCAVCTVKEGKPSAEEDVKVVLDYKEKTYVFCNEAEEAEFISDPKKYTGL